MWFTAKKNLNQEENTKKTAATHIKFFKLQGKGETRELDLRELNSLEWKSQSGSDSDKF